MHATEELQKDEKLVKEAIRHAGHKTLQFAHAELRRSKSFVLECVQINGDVLLNVEPELMEDDDFMLQAVRLAVVSRGARQRLQLRHGSCW